MTNRFFSYLAKLRRSRGFGVHSPFAFAFLMNVLNERKAAYYAYPALDALAANRRERNENRLIYRVLAFFNPAEVIAVGESPAAVDFAVADALPRAAFSREDAAPERWPALTIVNNVGEGAVIPDFSGAECVVLVRGLAGNAANIGFFNRLRADAPYGMAFYDRNIGIFVGRPTLPRQDFAVFLR